ncbi:unnamed protein product [Candidula unifasciata]|uniref:Phosphorylated adapter RNA export protein n=1 Tax=Candidula unifasciata TaxID=100452 RepID=A0A8S3Z1Y8_9EUPU|nr:unnamed protein product [Candidula unifasciata]
MAAHMDDRDVDLEEGECSNSDGEQTEFTSLPSAPFVRNKNVSAQNSGYHSRIPQIIINSDESDDGSDDDYPSTWKKARSPQSRCQVNGGNPSDVPFINPLLADKSGTNTARAYGQRRRNNVWGSVITEQVLSQEVKMFGVDNSGVLAATRDVESYDFTKAKEDERPDVDIDPDEVDNSRDDIFDEGVDLEKEVLKHENRKRKRHVKERLGKRQYNNQKRPAIKITADDSVANIVAAITKGLSEPKTELFTRIVDTVGKDLAIKLFYMTEDVEQCGGMMTNDGYRRRTPGGVYIQLLKNDASVSADVIESIFRDDQQAWKEKLKEQRKIKKAGKRRKRHTMRHMDIDRPDTPAPAEDLEALNALDSGSECENTDLPERPATPEPKDDSSDGPEDDDVDEEEEDDISVAIAKARAAILKKQRELAKGIIDREKLLGDNSMPSCNGSGDVSDSSLKDNEMTDSGSGGKLLSNKIRDHGLISPDRSSADVEIGEMEDL